MTNLNYQKKGPLFKGSKNMHNFLQTQKSIKENPFQKQIQKEKKQSCFQLERNYE